MPEPTLGSYVWIYWTVGTQYGSAGKVTGHEYDTHIQDVLAAGYGVLTDRPDFPGDPAPLNPNAAVSLAQLDALGYLTTTDANGTYAPALVVDENAPTPYRYQEPGDTDDTASFQRLFAAGHALVHIPQKSGGATWDISSTLTIPAGTSVYADASATIKAVATIAGPMFDTPVGTRIVRHSWIGGTLDCNDLAQNGFYIRNFSDYRLENFEVKNATRPGVILADPATSANPPTGAKLTGFKIGYPITHAALSVASAGLKLNRCTDGWFDRGTIVGYDTGVYIGAQGGGNIFYNVHPWGWPSALLMSRAFDDYGKNNKFFSCLADTATTYGYHFRNSWANPTVVGGGYFNYSSGNDNVSVGVKIEGTNAIGYFAGLNFEGTATSRISKAFDYDYTTFAGFNGGHRYEQVVNKAEERIAYTGRQPLSVSGPDGEVFRVQGITGSLRANLYNGARLQGFADSGAGAAKFILDATTGVITPGRANTASRPAAATAGLGGQFYDSDLGEVIWSDSTQWKRPVVRPASPTSLPNTTGADLATLEAEVNKIKLILRNAGLAGA